MTTSQSPNQPDSKPASAATTTTEKTSTDDLLGELESIVGLLEESTQDNPTSDDPVEQSFDEDIFAESDLAASDDGFDPDSLDTGLDIDIPILDDVVPAAANDQAISAIPDTDSPEILDIARIFEDEEALANQATIGEEAEPEASLEAEDEHEPDLSLELDLENMDLDFAIPDFKLTTLTADSDRSAEPATVATAGSASQTICEPHKEQPLRAAAEDSIDIDLLIQEIVDDLIPVMEDQLRKRLSEATRQAIQQLARTLNIS